MEFLGTAKTERECNAYIIEKAKKNGFTAFDRTKPYKPGDKVYYDNRGKAVILAVMGKRASPRVQKSSLPISTRPVST